MASSLTRSAWRRACTTALSRSPHILPTSIPIAAPMAIQARRILTAGQGSNLFSKKEAHYSSGSGSGSGGSSTGTSDNSFRMGILVGLAGTGLLTAYVVTKTSLLHSDSSSLVLFRPRKDVDSQDKALTTPNNGALTPTTSPHALLNGKPRPLSPTTGLPYFTRDEVRSHTTPTTGIWVTRGTAVYDITSFIDIHPGGERILLAAGQAIDPFWAIFSIHNTDSTRELLETYRIGDLMPLEMDPSKPVDTEASAAALAKLFANDPVRDPRLVVRSARPCNAETPADALLDSFTTPNHLFYVRNHLPVPAIDPDTFTLTVDLPGLPEASFSLRDLKEKFPKTTVMATLQCAGNRRDEMHGVKPVKGLLWQRGAISNATWGGVLLSDLLRVAATPNPDALAEPFDTAALAGNPAGVAVDAAAPVEDAAVPVRHVHFEGAEGYGASIPLSKAVSPTGDVLLAYEMNGEPLPPDHGAPLRAVVPGHVAARSVKWLTRVAIADEESGSHWQRKDYKGFGPAKSLETSDYDAAVAIQELPVQSAVVEPRAGGTVGWDPVTRTVGVRGYAWAGGGRGIVRVDVSADGGKTWYDAQVLRRPGQPWGREWAWTQWEARVPVEREGEVEIVCKAVDGGYNEQPERMESVYNVRGVLVSAWHRVRAEAKAAAAEKAEKAQK
ncbi:hypothetical protein HDU96_002487 [Phlyctochytrium bullatum]|nr:hypothetical protein HDU96_002487 [Phlyctochytrium bullatum]